MFAGAPHPHAPGGSPAAATLSPAAAGPSRAIASLAAGLTLALFSAGAARAEPAAPQPAEVAPVTVTGARPQTCVASEDAAKTLKLTCPAAQTAAPPSPTQLAPSAASPNVAVGVVSATALAEQFGANLGKSVHPYRPAPPPAAAPSPLSRRP
jgi:hypothetical protein